MWCVIKWLGCLNAFSHHCKASLSNPFIIQFWKKYIETAPVKPCVSDSLEQPMQSMKKNPTKSIQVRHKTPVTPQQYSSIVAQTAWRGESSRQSVAPGFYSPCCWNLEVLQVIQKGGGGGSGGSERRASDVTSSASKTCSLLLVLRHILPPLWIQRSSTTNVLVLASSATSAVWILWSSAWPAQRALGNFCILYIVPLTAVWEGVFWGNRMSCVFRVRGGGGCRRMWFSLICFPHPSSQDQECRSFAPLWIWYFHGTLDGWAWIN